MKWQLRGVTCRGGVVSACEQLLDAGVLRSGGGVVFRWGKVSAALWCSEAERGPGVDAGRSVRLTAGGTSSQSGAVEPAWVAGAPGESACVHGGVPGQFVAQVPTLRAGVPKPLLSPTTFLGGEGIGRNRSERQ